MQYSLFNLFSIQDRVIQDSNSNDVETQQEIVEKNNQEEGPDDGDNNDDNFDEDAMNLVSNYNPLNPIGTFVRIDNEYEKKFGRLYKTFDVRFLKSKIWESLSGASSNILNVTALNETNNDNNNFSFSKPAIFDKVPEEGINFQNLMGDISNNLSKEVLNNISTPTCFVCLLHLCNEKSKFFLNIKF